MKNRRGRSDTDMDPPASYANNNGELVSSVAQVMCRQISPRSERVKMNEDFERADNEDDDDDANKFELPESTFTMIITESIFSAGFCMAIFAQLLSLVCLFLAFKSQKGEGEGRNPLGLGPDVSREVDVTRYIAILVAVLNESEIPTALEIIGKGIQQSGNNMISMRKIVLSSCMRLLLGYVFLTTVFVSVVQSTDVLQMFMNLLALQFVEEIDDILFELSKRGFMGRWLMNACEPCYIEIETEKDTSKPNRVNIWINRIIRFFFIANIFLCMSAMVYFSSAQHFGGRYRCKSFTVVFGDGKEGGPTAPDESWQGAYISTSVLGEQRLLMYSHFNGIYEEEGSHAGRPRYVERNKIDGKPFKDITPAEIVYCVDIKAWVFRHEQIRTADDYDNENPCSWLLKSPETDSYDMQQMAQTTDWDLWEGRVKPYVNVVVSCNDCEETSLESCNYNGVCGSIKEYKCECNDGFFGSHCEFLRPCNVIRSEKDENATLPLKIIGSSSQFTAMYGRPMYAIHGLTGKPDEFMRLGFTGENQPEFEGDMSDDDFFYLNNASTQFQRLMSNYTFVLKYSGLRWYGSLLPPGKLYYTEGLFAKDYHAFWDEAFSGVGEPDNSTFLISAPNTDDLTPVGVDFYEMRRRNIPSNSFSYGSMGIVLPLITYPGAGFYHCVKEDKVGTYVGPPESAMGEERVNNTATTALANVQQTGAHTANTTDDASSTVPDFYDATTNGVNVPQEDNVAAYVPLSQGADTVNAIDAGTSSQELFDANITDTKQTGDVVANGTDDVDSMVPELSGSTTNDAVFDADDAEVQQTGAEAVNATDNATDDAKSTVPEAIDATTADADAPQEDNNVAAYVPLSLGADTANVTDSVTNQIDSAKNQTVELFGAATTDVAQQTEVSTGNQITIMDNQLVVDPTDEVQQTGGAEVWW